MITDTQLLRYSRHVLLNEWDISGQEAILASRVLVVGCGGLAHPALTYLVSAGVGNIVLADDDTVELSNLQRQFWFTEADIAKNKAKILQQRLGERNPDVVIHAHACRVDADFLQKYLPKVDCVLDCTDNFVSRCLINRMAHQYQVPLISASALMFSGQLAVYDFRCENTPCYQCVFDGNINDVDAACAKNGVFSPLLGIMGAAQAAESLKLLANINTQTKTVLHHFDALRFQWHQWQVQKNPACPICGQRD
ncbi:HesA/MoeB/ThiF family protein [Stenoxybacter acetivorans]|uniref:HesA/MoeB/ThiF family protein n=1 Tax=Stenoxybacter acetivorans TaxID=422441 RepID=UPI00055BC3C4|nr:HesA/MoeB/ThiF family protein [Stenoxybacter acetivorans]